MATTTNRRLKCRLFCDSSNFSASSSEESATEETLNVSLAMRQPSPPQPGAAKVARLWGHNLAPSRVLVKRKLSQNLITKILTRERFGIFSNRPTAKRNVLPFQKVPERLSFRLKDIVPFCYLDNHVFMGLTACGQFLLSYTVVYEEDEESAQHYSFTNAYKYKLFFWIYRPNTMLLHFYEVCLFDDHGVDNMKTVSMTQWLTNPRVLIVHGASACETEDSYITYVAVPKLGCGDCRDIRQTESDEHCRTDTLCIKCNLTIHTKYMRTDSDPVLVPRIHFNHPESLIMISNGFIHVLNVRLEGAPPPPPKAMLKYSGGSYCPVAIEMYQQETTIDEIQFPLCELPSLTPPLLHSALPETDKLRKTDTPCEMGPGRETARNIAKQPDAGTMVANIIADFAECETSGPQKSGPKNRIFSRTDRHGEDYSKPNTTNTNRASSSSGSNSKCNSNSNSNNAVIKLTQGTLTITSPEVEGASTSSRQLRSRKGAVLAANTLRTRSEGQFQESLSTTTAATKVDSYEFSEETEERCEKISLFRKKRLADKRYEFSEDNSENIIPFNRTKLRTPTLSSCWTLNTHHSPATSSSAASYFDAMPSHGHRASPNYGFRSPCGSPIGNRCLRSPTFVATNSNNYNNPTNTTVFSPSSSPSSGSGMFSPKHQPHYLKRFNSIHPAYLFSSPKRSCGELQEILPANIQLPDVPAAVQPAAVIAPQQEGGERRPPLEFSKKVVRRFVEETDAASVITNEEDDDCISPGYHTSLPVEVHGSCYANMQMISSSTSLQQLQCAHVQITQNSFDLEQFTFHVANHMCEKHTKKYGLFHDCACEIVAVCKYSGIATCILMVHFTATDVKQPSDVQQQQQQQKKKQLPRTQSTSFFGTVPKNEEAEWEEKKKTGSKYDCMNCSSNLDCVFHRKHYQCRSLFTWDIATGEWRVLDYGELTDVGPKWKNPNNKKYPAQLRTTVRQLASELRNGGGLVDAKGKSQRMMGATEDMLDAAHLRVLDSCNEKSKESLVDLRNCIEFYRGKVTEAGYQGLSDYYQSMDDDDGEEEEEEEEEDDGGSSVLNCDLEEEDEDENDAD